MPPGADHLRKLYGDRLVDVLVFGSRARGDADDDSDLDLLVVLDRVDDPRTEHDLMDETLWHHTFSSGVVVTAFPVARERYEHPDVPVLIRAKAEAVPRRVTMDERLARSYQELDAARLLATNGYERQAVSRA